MRMMPPILSIMFATIKRDVPPNMELHPGSSWVAVNCGKHSKSSHEKSPTFSLKNTGFAIDWGSKKQTSGTANRSC